MMIARFVCACAALSFASAGVGAEKAIYYCKTKDSVVLDSYGLLARSKEDDFVFKVDGGKVVFGSQGPWHLRNLSLDIVRVVPELGWIKAGSDHVRFFMENSEAVFTNAHPDSPTLVLADCGHGFTN